MNDNSLCERNSSPTHADAGEETDIDNSVNDTETNALGAAPCSASGISWWASIWNWFEKRRKEKEATKRWKDKVDADYEDAVRFFNNFNQWLEENEPLSRQPDSEKYFSTLNDWVYKNSHSTQHNNG